MEDMWRSRAKPTPLDFDGIREGTFSLPSKPTQQLNGGSTVNGSSDLAANGASGSSAMKRPLENRPLSTSAGLKDQRDLTLQDNLQLFVARYVLCMTSFNGKGTVTSGSVQSG